MSSEAEQQELTPELAKQMCHFLSCNSAQVCTILGMFYDEAAEWRATRDAYAPSLMLIKVSCLPFSMIKPFFTTAIMSAPCIVDKRCATITVVRLTITRSSASCTTRSDSASSALVASSSKRILGSFTMARAIATRCFCPPDS